MVALNVFALAAILPAMVLAHSAGQQAHGSVHRRHHSKAKAARALAGERNTTRALKRKRNTHRKRKCRPAPGHEGEQPAEQGAQEWSEPPADQGAQEWSEQSADQGTQQWSEQPADQGAESWDVAPTEGGEWQEGSTNDAGNFNYGNEFHAEGAPEETTDSGTTTSTGSSQQSTGGDGSFRLGRTLSGPCGSITTNDNCPNGEQWWLNCGISLDDHDAAWAPPFMGLEDIVYQDFSHGDWAGCEAFAWAFNDPECNLGVNPAILAAIARQESSCNPDVRGKNGEYGLMQVMPFNCMDESVCQDVWQNIRNGANVFKTYLDQSGGNVLLALGKYNGWKENLTYNQATQAARDGNCWAQNNLDYLHQMLNGFVVGRNAYANDFPTMFSGYSAACLPADAPRRELRRVPVIIPIAKSYVHDLTPLSMLTIDIPARYISFSPLPFSLPDSRLPSPCAAAG